MARIPSIKGTSFESAVLDVLRLLETGLLRREDLERRLSDQELRYLDERIEPPLWYPMESFVRFSEIACEVEGGGRNEYYIEAGRRSAERLSKAQVYRQLATTSVDWGRHVLRMQVSLGPTLNNFGEWTYEEHQDEGYDAVRVRDAAPMAEPIRYRNLGFVRYILESSKSDVYSHITSERPAHDEVVYKFFYKKNR